MSTRTQTELPGVDMTLVRLQLEGLADHYSERVARAESGSEVDQLVYEYAKAGMRELNGLQGREVETLRAYFRDILVRTGDALAEAHR